MPEANITPDAAKNDTAAAEGSAGDVSNQNQATTPGARGAAPAPDGGAPAPEWVTALPEDLRTHAAGMQSVEDLVKAHADLKGKLPVVPEKADGYTLPKVDGVEMTEHGAKAVREAFHKAGLTQEQVDAVLNLHGQTIHEGVTQRMAEGEKALQEFWKGDFQKNVDLANRAVKRFASPDLITFLGKTGLSNDPEVVRMFHAIGSAMSEDSLVQQDKGQGGEKTAAQVLYGNMKQ